MKLFKITLTLISFAILIILALPEFSLNIGNTIFTYPSVGFSKIGIGADFGSLTKGKDIYSGKIHTGTVQFGDQNLKESEKREYLTKTIKTISNRLNFAELYDVEVKGEIKNNQYNIILIFPNYYESTGTYTQWILSRGEITFSNGQDNNIIIIEDIRTVAYSNNIRFEQTVNNNDGQSSVRQNSVTGSNLILDVNPRREKEIRRLPSFVSYFNDFFSGQGTKASLLIDEVNQLALIRDDNNPTHIRVLPLDAETSIVRKDILSIVNSYFREESALRYPIEINPEFGTSAPLFNLEGTTFIAITIIIGLIFLTLTLSRHLKRKKTILFVSSMAFSLLVLINILKFVQTPISSGFIVGIIFIIVFYTFVFFDLLNISENKAGKSNNYLILSLIFLFSIVSIHFIRLDLGVFIQTTEVIVAGLIALIVSIVLHVNFIIKTFLIENLSFSKLFKIRTKYEKN